MQSHDSLPLISSSVRVLLALGIIVEFLRWAATIINSILSWDIDRKQVQIGTTKMRLELADTIEFENTLNKRIVELNLRLIASRSIHFDCYQSMDYWLM